MATSNPVLAQSYDSRNFIDWSAWDEMERHLRSRGVCAGVGGARGSGKSWLLRRATEWADENDGIGVYFPSPSAYDASAFLSGLCLALATKTELKLRRPRYAVTTILELMNKRSVQIGAVVVAVAVVAFFLRDSSLSRVIPVSILSAVIVYGYIALPAWWRQQRLQRDPRYRLYLRSLAIQRWVQFSAASKSSSEFSLEAGKGLIGRGKISEELALSERPVTELALVTEFRALAEQLSREEIKVVVAIDELDKIGSVEDVRKLLRSVKGVLDPAGVVLLVSVSDEAVTHLGLSGLRGRDEISSSFTSMMKVPPLRREELRTLIESLLGVQKDDVADVVWVLTAGNHREAVRLLDDSLSVMEMQELSRNSCIDVASSVEAREFLNSLVGDREIGEVPKASAYRWVDKWRVQEPESDSLLSFWDPPWAAESGWPDNVAEEWRRYLVRHALRIETRKLVGVDDPDKLNAMAEAFLVSQHSAGVARQLLRKGQSRNCLESETRNDSNNHALRALCCLSRAMSRLNLNPDPRVG